MIIYNALPGAIIPAEGGQMNLYPISWGTFAEEARINNARSAVGHQDTATDISWLCTKVQGSQREAQPCPKEPLLPLTSWCSGNKRLTS